MSHTFRTTILSTAVALAAVALWSPASAQESYPSRPVKIIIGVGPGSGTDSIARVVAQEMIAIFKQPFVVENKPGASVQIAATAVKNAPPDGYTLFLTSSSSHSINPHIFKNLPYDPIKDFTPIGAIADFPFVLAVNPELPIKTPQDLVRWAHANKGKVNYAYGTPAVRIPVDALNKIMKLDAVGIPYKSSPDAMADVMGGRVAFMVTDIGVIKAGTLRAIATTGAKRTSLAPTLPTIEESLGIQNFDLAAWTGLFGPAGLPQDVVDKLSAALLEMLNRPDIRERMLGFGAEAAPTTPKGLEALVKRQLDAWGAKVKDAGIQPE